MKNILMIAFDCNPMLESESLVAFKTAFHVSENNNVTVITRPKCQSGIEEWFSNNEAPNLHFVYIDCPIYKKTTDFLKGFVRTFFLSKYVNKWMSVVVKKIKELSTKTHFDVIHRLTPNSYRIVPDISEFIDSIRVIGPVGGAQEIPDSLMVYAKDKNLFEEKMHRLVNNKILLSKKFIKRINQFDYILSCNSETLEALKKSAPNKKHVLITDVGAEENEIISEKESKDSTFTFLWVGRYVFRKGLDMLLEALVKLKHEQFKVVMVGDGPEKNKIISKAETLGLEDKIDFIGRVPHSQVDSYYQRADAFVFPSLRESSGGVLAEALSHQLPVIALDIGGAHTICSNKESILIPVSGNKDEIVQLYANGMKSLLENDILNNKKKNCFNRCENSLSWNKKAALMEAIYESRKN